MKCTREEHWPLTTLGLVAIFCACLGCSSLEITAKRKSANRHPMGLPTVPSADVGNAVPPSPSSTTETGPTATNQQSKSDSSESQPKESEIGQSDTEDVITLKVTEIVMTALSNNLHLRVIANLPDMSVKQAEIERALFDTSINANMQYLQGVQQVASALQAVQGGQSQYGTTSFGPTSGTPNLISIEQRYSTGTTARIGLGSNYNLTSPIGQYLIYNPAFQTAASVVVEQALFRGNSRRANLAGIHIAQTSQKQSAAEFQIEVNQMLSDLQRAYWMAWLAESQLKTNIDFVEQAQATRDLEQKRFELGAGGIVQSAQATEHLHSLKAELAQAKQRSRAARNHLFSLMGASLEDQRPLKLADDPYENPVMPDLQQGLSTAAELRPEIQVRKLQIAQAQLELERRKNNQLPDVRAYAGYSLTGLNSSLVGSVNQFDSAHFGTMSLGVRYSYVFGQRAARAALDQAQLALVRQIRGQQETEFVIKQQVRDAFDSVNSSWEVYRCQQERVAAAQVQAQTLNELHAAGQIDLDRLLRARQQLSNALQQSYAALIDYNLSLNSWQLAIGTMTVPLTSPDRSDENADRKPNEQPRPYLPPDSDLD